VSITVNIHVITAESKTLAKFQSSQSSGPKQAGSMTSGGYLKSKQGVSVWGEGGGLVQAVTFFLKSPVLTFHKNRRKWIYGWKHLLYKFTPCCLQQSHRV